MINNSIWLENIKRTKYPKLNNDITCDILIIGGGITGICTAHFLKNSSQDIVLVEGNEIATGTTSKSTGKLTFLQENIIEKIKSNYNTSKALEYIKSQQSAIKLAKQIIIDNNIDCDFQEVSSYLFTTKNKNISKINKTYVIVKKQTECSFKDKLPIKIKVARAIKANNTYVFHPVKFVLNLANKLENTIGIYEHTRIIELKHAKKYWLAKTNSNIIKAKKVVLACHYPFFLKPYYFPFKTSIEKSFIVASKVDKVKLFSAINIDSNILSFRYHKDLNNYFIFCSESNDLSKNMNDIKIQKKILSTTKNKFTNDISYCWSNHDIMTADYMPLIGKIDNNLYLATGYNTWGMTNGILAGKIISDLILRRHNEYKALFNPLRSFNNLPTLINYNLKNGLSYIDTKINKNKSFYNSDVKIIKENGIWYGIYIDEFNIEHKVLNKCPHMKCNLSFNYQTKSWDCPCHGSSFDIDGNIIYGPATYNIKVNKK